MGKFIAIEGNDGSGKATHTALLADWLRDQGHSVALFDFPRYQEPSSYFVRQYLAGRYGSLQDTDAYRGSLFYAMDRFEAGPSLRQALQEGSIVICNRYVGSNMGHQGSKISDPGERQKYYQWNDDLEYRILGIPRPHLNLVLLMPSGHARRFIADRAKNAGSSPDLHESAPDHLRRAEQTYRELVRLFPDQFVPVDCARQGKVLPLDEIQSAIRALVSAVVA